MLRDALRSCQNGLDMGHLRSIAIVGCATEGQRLAAICTSQQIDIEAIVDDDATKIGSMVAGRSVEPSSALERVSKSTPIVIASHRVCRATQQLRALGFTTVVPFATLQTLAPSIFPPHMFYDGLLEDLWAHRAQYRLLGERLADDQSREVLDAVIGFRQTIDPAVLMPVVSEDDLYAPKGLFEFTDDEVYVDGGSYDGDTIRAFATRVSGRFASVYGFEPDPVTFGQLKASFQDDPRVHPVHAGLYSRSGHLHFRNDATRGAIFADDGEIEMPVTTIDEVLGDERPTYIKMNIEGAEIDALRGGQQAIRRCQPRLAISVYHRPTDLWQIPQLVTELSADYKLYLRQHDGGIIETVLYALPGSLK
jgi:FkbM family methyltransferase